MSKSHDASTEIVRTQKNSFRNTDARPAKPQKRRYERRKVKECIRSSDWIDDDLD